MSYPAEYRSPWRAVDPERARRLARDADALWRRIEAERAAEPAAEPAGELEAIRQELDALRRQIARLEERLRRLEGVAP